MELRSVAQHCLLAGTFFLATPGFLRAAEQKKVVVDFEDFGTWRIKESSGMKRGAWWPADLGLSGSNLAKYRDDSVGEIRFAFDPAGKGPFVLGFERHKMTLTSGFLKAIEFDADARNFPVSVRFDIQDAANRVFRTRPIALDGDGWKRHRLDLNAETLPGFANCKFPARLKRVALESASPVEGAIFLDDITLAGTFTKKDQLSVTPIYEGIYYSPEKDVALKYRVRNASPEAQTGSLKLVVRDFTGRKIHSADAPLSLPATGAAEVAFPLGKLPIGAYEVALSATTGALQTAAQDHFGVFTPNNGQPNQHPMWFGIADQTSWQGALENARHWEWMKILGVDINRLGVFPDRLEPEPGMIAEEGWGRMIQGHADAGVDVMILYDGTPSWTQSKRAWRGPADLLPQFEEHARHLGAFLKKYPNVTWLEFWNEPDVEFFHGTLTEYLEMFRHFSKGIKETHPDLTLLNGGVTVQHPKEKPGFSKGMFQQGGDIYDIAAYHAHGPAINNQQNQKLVETWLSEAGLDKPFVNTETGDRSLHDPEGRYRQAITLIKKIVYSKSLPKFQAYFWFTLQDYWDMDPEADDSFGLVTSDNRAKPSFVAYNTLINRLANTTPATDAPPIEGLTLHAFRKNDGRHVYAGWPSESKSSGILWIKAEQSVEVSDMFGATREYAPLGSVLPIPFGDQPLYISTSKPDEKIQICPPGEEFLNVATEVNVTGDQPFSLPVEFRNPTEATLEGSLTLRDYPGNPVASREFKLEAGEKLAWQAAISPEKSETHETQIFHLDLQLTGPNQPAFSFPVQLIGTCPIRKVAPLGNDPAEWPALDAITPLVLNRPDQVVELSYDPAIPAWKGPADLSATARLAHDGKGIRLRIEVTDDTPGPVQPADQLWRGDDVQLAFAAPDAKKFAILDLGRSSGGPIVWCSDHPDPKRQGKWEAPLSVTQKGNITTYDVYLPHEMLALPEGKPNQPIRFTFMVNENDGKGRVRWIQWKDGIGKNRSLEMLGHGILQ